MAEPDDSSDRAGGKSAGYAGAEELVERFFWPLLLSAVVLSAGGTATVVFFQYDRVSRAVRTVPYAEKVSRAVQSLVGADTSSAREYGSFTRLDRLVVNPEGSGGRRHLALSIAFETSSEQAVSELESKKVVIRDAMINLLSRKTVEELSSAGQRDSLKVALREEANQILSQGEVDRLYFTEFVLQ